MEKKKYGIVGFDFAIKTLIVGGILMFFAPLLLTTDCFGFKCFDENTGFIGDTIGGITAPFASFLGSILVYYAFKQQVEANRIVTKQFEVREKKEDFGLLLNEIDKIQTEIDRFSVTKHFQAHIQNRDEEKLFGKEAIATFLNSHTHQQLYTINNRAQQDLENLLYMVDDLSGFIDEASLSQTQLGYLVKRISFVFNSNFEDNFKNFFSSFSYQYSKCDSCCFKHFGLECVVYVAYSDARMSLQELRRKVDK